MTEEIAKELNLLADGLCTDYIQSHKISVSDIDGVYVMNFSPVAGVQDNIAAFKCIKEIVTALSDAKLIRFPEHLKQIYDVSTKAPAQIGKNIRYRKNDTDVQIELDLTSLDNVSVMEKLNRLNILSAQKIIAASPLGIKKADEDSNKNMLRKEK